MEHISNVRMFFSQSKHKKGQFSNTGNYKQGKAKKNKKTKTELTTWQVAAMMKLTQ